MSKIFLIANTVYLPIDNSVKGVSDKWISASISGYIMSPIQYTEEEIRTRHAESGFILHECKDLNEVSVKYLIRESPSVLK